MIKVVSTKKLLPEIIEEARENGIEITEKSAIATQPILTVEKKKQLLNWLHNNRTVPVVFTSSNAVSSLEECLGSQALSSIKGLKVFCLSGRTRDAVTQAFSMTELPGMASSGMALAKEILKKVIHEVVFFCGHKRRDELPDLLRQNGVVVHEIVVYETVSTPFIVKEDMDAIMFFSPSAVESFFTLNQLNKNIVCFAIGETTADSILKYSGNTIIISDTPSQEGMLKSLLAYKHLITSAG